MSLKWILPLYFSFSNVGTRQFKITLCSSHFSCHDVSVGQHYPYEQALWLKHSGSPLPPPALPTAVLRDHTWLSLLSHRMATT